VHGRFEDQRDEVIGPKVEVALDRDGFYGRAQWLVAGDGAGKERQDKGEIDLCT
jgi:hypothetical protein